MVSQETIIYRLYIKKLGFRPFFDFSSFWALLGPKKGRGPTDTHIGLGPQNPTKKVDPLGGPFGSSIIISKLRFQLC